SLWRRLVPIERVLPWRGGDDDAGFSRPPGREASKGTRRDGPAAFGAVPLPAQLDPFSHGGGAGAEHAAEIGVRRLGRRSFGRARSLRRCRSRGDGPAAWTVASAAARGAGGLLFRPHHNAAAGGPPRRARTHAHPGRRG